MSTCKECGSVHVEIFATDKLCDVCREFTDRIAELEAQLAVAEKRSKQLYTQCQDSYKRCDTLTQERDAARGLLDALHTEADNAMREIDAVRISSGTVACRLANEMRYGFISLSKKIRKAKAEEAHDERI